MRGPRFRFGSFELDGASNELRKNGLRIRIEDQPSRILSLLVSRPGEIVTREELKQALWADETHVDFDRSLTRAVNKVRAAINDTAANPRFVETLPKKGYRFIAPVTRIDEHSDDPSLATKATIETPDQNSNLHEMTDAAGAPASVRAARDLGVEGLNHPAGRPRYPGRSAVWGIGGIAIAAVLALGEGTWRSQREELAKTASADSAYKRGILLVRERTLAKVKQGADELSLPGESQVGASLGGACRSGDPAGSVSVGCCD